MKKMLLVLLGVTAGSHTLFAQATTNVGIGTTTPAYKLEVIGKVRSSSDLLVGGYVGIGTTTPNFRLQVTDGSLAMYSSADSKYWYQNYNSTGNFYQLVERDANGSDQPRLVVTNGGLVGINNTEPIYRLDVGGSIRASNSVYVGGTSDVAGSSYIGNNLYVTGNATISTNLSVTGTVTLKADAAIEGNASVDGNITMNGKGLLYNAASNAKLRYYTRTAAFTVVSLAPWGISPEGSIGFSGFTSAPEVFVGDITTTGGTTGQLWKCQLIIYDVTKDGCKCRISNTSNTTINQDITWNISCIGKGN